MRKIRDVYSKAQADQLQYKHPRKVIRSWFKKRDILIATDIWIHPRYPYGWDAILGAWDRVWILRVHQNNITVVDIQHVQGFRRNGTLIVS